MHINTPGCSQPFTYAADLAEEQARKFRQLGASRDVAYGMLLRLVIDENEDCDIPDALVIGAVRNVCEMAIAQAWVTL